MAKTTKVVDKVKKVVKKVKDVVAPQDVKKVYLNYGSDDQIILWRVEDVDMDLLKWVNNVTIVNLTTWAIEEYRA